MMNRRKALLCLVSICGLLCLLLLGDNYFPKGLCFSRESGFYEEPFALELSAPFGAKIYYTLDGSVPDENALPYTAPIWIEDASSNPNVHAMRTDLSYETTMAGVPYQLPDYPVDKCTIIRAACQDADGNFGEVKTESYFVGYDDKAGYDGMNVVSVVTDPANLFDYDKGIYVFGRGFDAELDEDGNHIDKSENFNQHGFLWERPADIQLFDAGRETILKQSCGVRIQGGGSRETLPKSLNFYARDSYGMAKRFYADLFGTDYMADTLTLTAGGQDTIIKFRDRFVAALTGERDFCTAHYEPYVMFLDGEYWGVYWLAERYTGAYIEHYYGVDKDNVLIVKNGRPESESDEDWSIYNSMTNYLTDTDFSDPVNYESLDYVIDVQSCLDYYAAEIYIARSVDWPGTNEAFWRARKPVENGGSYEDGRWRWMLFDVNTSSFDVELVGEDSLKWVLDRSPAFANLCSSEQFREAFCTTIMDFANEVFSPANTEPLMEQHLAFMKEPLERNLDRFFGRDYSGSPEEEMADIGKFLANRKPYIEEQLKENFGLEGEAVSVGLETTDASAGSITLNSITPTFDEQGKWEGEYFTDYPVTLSAAVNEGCSFVGWEIVTAQGKETIAETTLELEIPEEGVHVKAVFEGE